jgi:SAM-dependent methyltransferase
MGLSRAYDEVASTYDELYQDPDSVAENNAVRGLLRGMGIERCGGVVDLGCGTGLLLDLVDVVGTHYRGYDLSPGMVQKATEKHPGHAFECADVRELGFELLPSCIAVSLFTVMNYMSRAEILGITRFLRLNGATSFAYGLRHSAPTRDRAGIPPVTHLHEPRDLQDVLRGESRNCEIRVLTEWSGLDGVYMIRGKLDPSRA